MKIIEIILESIGTLGLNKLRTGLAILGIIIGIGSVITLISLGAGSQKAVENQVQSLGANLLTVMPAFQRSGNVRTSGSMTTLTLADAMAIINNPEITTISDVSPELSSRFQVVTKSSNSNVSVIGVYPQYASIRKVAMQSGVFISMSDVDAVQRVAVLGPQVATDLFGEGFNPIGETVRINKLGFRIIGVTQSKGGNGFNNQDNTIYIPLSTLQKQLSGADHLSSIAIEAKSAQVMVQAQDQVGFFLPNSIAMALVSIKEHHHEAPQQVLLLLQRLQDSMNPGENDMIGNFPFRL